MIEDHITRTLDRFLHIYRIADADTRDRQYINRWAMKYIKAKVETRTQQTNYRTYYQTKKEEMNTVTN